VISIGNELAYCEVVRNFVRRNLGADEFLTRFAHLWQSDPARQGAQGGASHVLTPEQSVLVDALARIHSLCETYRRSLSPGCGYRASEDQFRAEVRSIARTSALMQIEDSEDER
jgi:hypothetical protein